jgi:molybdopterin converting factor small subunit
VDHLRPEEHMAQVKYYGQIRSIIGLSSEEITADNLKSLLSVIQKRYGKIAYKEAKRSLIVVDKLGLRKGLNIALNSDSEVRFYPICSGG